MVPRPNARTRGLLTLTRRVGNYFVFGVLLRIARTPGAQARGVVRALTADTVRVS